MRHLETHTLWVQEKVRTGAIEVRKVRGDVNPADLFTKHLPSKDKIHQLVGLFGCECRSGRSEAAPLLRPKDPSGGKGGQPSAGYLPTFGVSAAAVFTTDEGEVDHQIPHDVNILPHLHSLEEMNKLFPILSAPEPAPNNDDWEHESMGEAADGETQRG